MELRLSYDQRARLELIAINAGATNEELLMDAAELLLDRDASDNPHPPQHSFQRFLSEIELEERFARMLGH